MTEKNNGDLFSSDSSPVEESDLASPKLPQSTPLLNNVPLDEDDIFTADDEEDAAPADPKVVEALNKLSVSERFVMVNPGETHVMIWGTTQSGKTTFLATLLRELEAGHVADVNMVVGNKAAQQWYDRIFLRIFEDGVFPAGTSPDTVSTPVFNLALPSGQIIKLVFLDAPGEFFRDPEEAVRKYNLPFSVLSYIRQCHGLIMLVDPTLGVQRDPNGELRALANNINNLLLDDNGMSRGIKVGIPVAFCLTKCDEPKHRPAFDDTVGFVREHFGDLMVNLRRRVDHSEWFASSALGFTDGQPTNTFIRWDGTLGIRDLRAIEPKNVAEPLMWVLTQLGIYSANMP